MASMHMTTSHNSKKRNSNSQKDCNNGLRKQPCETNGIFWKTEDSKNSCSGTDAYIPGVDPSNSKKSKTLKWQPYKVQPKSSTTSSGHVVKDVSHSTNESAASEHSTGNQSMSQRSDSQNSLNDSKKIFLKDLCHEDKLRIASLIQELAKAGEEREEAMLKLNKEREDYEKKVQVLTSQVELLSDEHKQTLCKMTDCHHLLNLYQHILIEQQQKKRRHSMPVVTNASRHNKENAGCGPKTQNNSLQPPPRSSRARPLGNSAHLGDNLQPGKHVRRSLSPSFSHQDSLQPAYSHPEPRHRRSLSPCSPQPDNLLPASCTHRRRPPHHNHRQRRSLSPSTFLPDRLNTQHPKLNSCYLLPNEGGRQISPRTSPRLSERQPANKSPRPLIPETQRPNLKPATAIYKTSHSAPGFYGKIDSCIGDHSDMDGFSEFPNHFQESPRSVCSNNSGNQNNNCASTNARIHTPEPRTLPSLDHEKTSSPNIGLPKGNATFTNKSKTRLSLGPLQDPIMSSTQRSSELRFNGSFVSQNTASNQSCLLRSPSGSVRSLPTYFQSNKNSSTNPCVPLKFETAQSDSDYSYVRKLSFSSSVQSLPTALTHLDKAPHPGTGTAAAAAMQEADGVAVSKVSFADMGKVLPNSRSPIRTVDDGKEIKVPGTPNTDCFRSMSNEKRRQFLLQQRALLEEERNRLVAILERPDLAPPIGATSSMGFPKAGFEGGTDYPLVESRPNIVQGLGGASLVTNSLPLNCFEKSKNEPILRSNKPDSPPPPPPQNSNKVGQDFLPVSDDCCSVLSNCSFSSKQSSMSLIDLIDSIDLKPSEKDVDQSSECYTPQNLLRMNKFSRQIVNASYPQKQELNFENQVLQDIFFLN